MMKLEVIDWKEEYESDMEKGLGFIIDDVNSIVKDGKRRNPRGIYSPEYGTLTGGEDYNYTQRYSCECKALSGRIYQGMTCTQCGTEVKYNKLDIHKCGWMVLDDYCLIQPLMYQSLSKLIGPTNLTNIVKGERTIDREGNIKRVDVSEQLLKKNPFYNIGILELRDRLDEVCEYFLKKNSDKKVYYDFIMENKDKIFINHIPVFSLVLRDLTIINNNIIHEPINKIFNNLLGNICMLNKKTKTDKSMLKVLPNLYETQIILNELHLNIIKLVGGKEGHIRGQLLGFRVNFSSRNVIVPLNGDYKINEVVLPYLGMMMLYKFEIINLIKKFDNVTLSTAYNKWNKACETFDRRIYLIIKHLIDKTEGGLRVIINRKVIAAFSSDTNRKSF